MSELGDLIHSLRGKESLREAAERIGISHSYLNIIEKGHDLRSGKPVKPTPETLSMIATAYNYPYEKLMEVAGYLESRNNQEADKTEINLNNPELNVFFKDFMEAPEERKRELIKFWDLIKDAEKGRKLGDKQGE